jgi:hypothetical protein
LEFQVDVEDPAQAWEIADGLEQAAMSRGYVAASSHVEDPLGGDRHLAVGGAEVPLVSALSETPHYGSERTAIMDHGSPSSTDPSVGPRRYGDTS